MNRVLVLPALAGLLYALVAMPASTALATGGDWPTYLATDGRAGYNPAETTITPSTASTLRLHWTYQVPGADPISAQPIVANSLVYIGSWNGYETALSPSGSLSWQTYLGRSPGCSGMRGIADAPTITAENIGGVSTSVLYVGGGDGQVYALNALTGAVIWHTPVATVSGQSFLWSSPSVYNGSVYEGTSSPCDVNVRGALVQLSATTGAIQNIFYVVPSGCIGGGIWGSPTVDTATGTIYVATGDPSPCSQAEPYADAVLALRASDLSLISSWQVPPANQFKDSDFGTTPTLFTATINGAVVPLLGVGNKDGIYYAFNSTAIGSGPIWQDQLWPSGVNPTGGEGSISPSSFDGTTLYVAGGAAMVGGVKCKGSAFALNPATGAELWAVCMATGSVVGAVTGVPGLVEVAGGHLLRLIGTASGKTLFAYSDAATAGGALQGAGTISHGMLYHADMHGTLYAIGT